MWVFVSVYIILYICNVHVDIYVQELCLMHIFHFQFSMYVCIYVHIFANRIFYWGFLAWTWVNEVLHVLSMSKVILSSCPFHVRREGRYITRPFLYIYTIHCRSEWIKRTAFSLYIWLRIVDIFIYSCCININFMKAIQILGSTIRNCRDSTRSPKILINPESHYWMNICYNILGPENLNSINDMLNLFCHEHILQHVCMQRITSTLAGKGTYIIGYIILYNISR